MKKSQREADSVFNSFSLIPSKFYFDDSSQNIKCYDCIQDAKETFMESPANGWIKKNANDLEVQMAGGWDSIRIEFHRLNGKKIFA